MGPDEIRQVLEILAEKLGPMATKIWALYIRQVYIGVAQDVVAGSVCAILAYLGVRFGRYSQRRYKEEGSYSMWDWGVGTGFAGAFILALCALFLFFHAPWVLLNPEYHAIRLLLKTSH